jgi:LysR family hydrogen peroxide-inducible transcriptional activator
MNPQVIFKSGQFSSILSMVSKGLGVSIVPAMALEKRPGCRFVPLTDERATRTIGAIVLKERSQTRINEAFLDYVTG